MTITLVLSAIAILISIVTTDHTSIVGSLCWRYLGTCNGRIYHRPNGDLAYLHRIDIGQWHHQRWVALPRSKNTL